MKSGFRFGGVHEGSSVSQFTGKFKEGVNIFSQVRPNQTTHKMADLRFTQEHPMEKRKEVAAKIKDKYVSALSASVNTNDADRYPDRVPVIVERADNSDAPLMDKKKFLVPQV